MTAEGEVLPHVLERRAKVAKMLLQGLTVHEMVEKLGISAGVGTNTVYGDIRAIKEEWKTTSRKDIDEHKRELVEELRMVRKELWGEWEKSKGQRKSVSTSSRKVRPGRPWKKKGEDEEDTPSEGKVELIEDGQTQTVSVQDGLGSPAYTAQIMVCINQEANLIGIITKDGDQDATPPVFRMKIHVPTEVKEEENKEAS